MSDCRINRAVISVSEKRGVADFAKKLSDMGTEILSTGGTSRVLKEAGVPVVSVDSYTGSPEIMDGRVKTLHPKIHGGILAVRDSEKHMKELKDNSIQLIDMVVVNLYPFQQTVARNGVTIEDAIENIDIGGPTMVRSAAKNHRYVTVVVDPDDYNRIILEMSEKSAVSLETRKSMALKAFQHTAEYDSAISEYLAKTF